MKAKILLSALWLVLLSIGLSQSVTDATTSFSQVRTATGVTMTDFLADQATGQGADDFVVNGIYLKYGLTNGVQTQFVRAVFTNYQNKGFGGNFKVGIDANADGALDIVYGVVDTGSNRGIVFQTPTTGAVSTGSTSLGSATNVIPFSSTNYNYGVLDFGANNYGMLTFTIDFNSVQTALANRGITIDQNAYLRSIFFTATNQGAINQDVYGASGITNTLRFDSGGGFSEYRTFTGSTIPIPEPSMYGLAMSGFLSILYFLQKNIDKKPKQIELFNIKNNKGDEVAGSETQTAETPKFIPVKLPTEFTISRSSL
jgi:hypothetical protein